MKKEKDNYIKVPVKNMYQLLLSECRYGYMRNNHLMPSCAYDDVKNFLPIMLSQDIDYALVTAKQLCEECISSQLNLNFYDGLDDEFGNRKEAIEFIEYLLDFIAGVDRSFKPYNYDSYQDNLDRVNSMKYSLYKVNDRLEIDSLSLEGDKIPLIQGLNQNEIEHSLFFDILKNKAIQFNRINIYDEEHPKKIKGEFLRILTGKHRNEVYLIIKD